MTLTQTDGHPTSINFPLSPTEVDHPVRSIAEYILASEKMMWKRHMNTTLTWLSHFLHVLPAYPMGAVVSQHLHEVN